MKTIQDHAAWRGSNRYGTTFIRLDPHRQVTVLLDVRGLAHMHRDKATSSATKKARAYIAHMAVNDLRDAGHPVKNLLNLGDRHVRTILTVWSGQGLSASTLASRISILRWLTTALGKRGLVRDPVDYGFAAEDVHRPQVATEDKSWTTRGTDPATKLEEVAQEDPWVGIQLEMSRAFGLRVTEAILIKPRSAHVGDTLRVEEGTKGGRTRIVPVRTDEQRAVLERAKAMSDRSARGNLVPPRRTPAQARQHLYYVCRRHGITKGQLGITVHGLRHQYANDLYEDVSGTASTVRGGSQILDRAAEEAALRSVTNELGHARLGVTATYLGARKRAGAVRSETGQPARVAPPSAARDASSED